MLGDPHLPLFALGPKQYRAWPKALRPAEISYAPLSQLLTQHHRGDAHLAAYSVPQVLHRLGTDPAAYLRPEIPHGVPMAVLLVDVDCAASHRALGGSGAVAADDRWWSDIRARIERLDADHPGAFAYRTRGGARIVYRLAVPHLIADGLGEIAWKRLYLAHLARLARRYGLHGDPSISDWPRLVRLPHVTRDGKFAAAETLGDPFAVGALDEPGDDPRDVQHARGLVGAIPAWAPALRLLAGNVQPAARTARTPRTVEPRPVVDVGQLGALAADLGRALRRHSARHAVHLALAGAILERGLPPAQAPTLARAICAASGETDDRPQVWQTTADRIASGQVVTGYGHLLRHWPDLAALVDAALPRDGGAATLRARLDARPPVPLLTAEAATETIRAAIADTSPGLRVLRVTEGAGKTRAAVAVLRERALAVGAAERVSSAAKTLYVAPTHAVAAEVASALAGVRGEYLRGVLAVRRPDGSPACAYHVPLSRLTGARHAASTWCEGIGQGHRGAPSPCPHRSGCEAIDRARVSLGGAGTPAVVVTVHALLAQGLAWAGPDALVVLDEDPQALESVTLTRTDLETAAGAAPGLARSERWRAPVLRALAAGIERGELAADLDTIATRGGEALLGDGAWTAAVAESYPDPDGGITHPRDLLRLYAERAAYVETRAEDGSATWRRRGPWAPRLSRVEHARVFAGGASERAVEASRVHATVARLVAGVLRRAPAGAELHAERAVAALEVAPGDGSHRVLRTVLASPAVCAALQRPGPTVLLDATADVEVLRAIARDPRIPVTDVRVADGAPVTRAVLHWAGASRRTALPSGTVRWGEGVERYLRAALAHVVDQGARRVAVFTWKPLADVLRAAIACDVAADPIAAAIVADLRARGVSVSVGHYGDARGRNDWAACDALVSFGDPRPNVGASRAIAAVLGLGDTAGAIYARQTAAELSQVSGRLRAPWRTTTAVHVHVGTAAPESWGAESEVLDLPKGPGGVIASEAIAQAIRVHGSARLAAAATGVSHRTAKAHSANAAKPFGNRVSPTVQSNTVNTYNREAPCTVGDTLKTRRFELTQGEAAALIEAAGGAAAVATLLGVSRATVYHWRSGARPMPAHVRAQLLPTSPAFEAPPVHMETPQW